MEIYFESRPDKIGLFLLFSSSRCLFFFDSRIPAFDVCLRFDGQCCKGIRLVQISTFWNSQDKLKRMELSFKRIESLCHLGIAYEHVAFRSVPLSLSLFTVNVTRTRDGYVILQAGCTSMLIGCPMPIGKVWSIFTLSNSMIWKNMNFLALEHFFLKIFSLFHPDLLILFIFTQRSMDRYF